MHLVRICFAMCHYGGLCLGGATSWAFQEVSGDRAISRGDAPCTSDTLCTLAHQIELRICVSSCSGRQLVASSVVA